MRNMHQKTSIKKPFLNGKKRIIISQSLAFVFLSIAIIKTIVLVHSFSGKLYLLGSFISSGVASILLCVVGFAIAQFYCFDRLTYKGMVKLTCYVFFNLIIVRSLSLLYGIGYI